MKKLIATIIIIPLMCLTIYAQGDFNLNGISALNIGGTGNDGNIQPPLASASKNTNDAYDFPVKPGAEEWKAFTNHGEMQKACQIQESLLRIMSTAGLIETVLNYPLYWDIMASNSGLQKGFNRMAARFNGVQELLMRKDAGTQLLLKYRSIPPLKKEATDMEIGEYLFYCYSFEILFAQDAIRAGLTEAQLKEMKKELLAKYEIRKELKIGGGFGKEIMELNGLLPQRRSTKAFPTVVYTPKLSEVKAWQKQKDDEMDWHDQTGLSQIWIDAPNQKQYWLDGSYSLLHSSTGVSGMKLDYALADHSAIFVSGEHPTISPITSTCRSKWGNGPRMLHTCSYCPYNSIVIGAYTLSPPAGN